jgi:hypothetical protein
MRIRRIIKPANEVKRPMHSHLLKLFLIILLPPTWEYMYPLDQKSTNQDKSTTA